MLRQIVRFFRKIKVQQPFDWELTVNALRTGQPDDIADALALLKSNEVEEVEGPPAHRWERV